MSAIYSGFGDVTLMFAMYCNECEIATSLLIYKVLAFDLACISIYAPLKNGALYAKVIATISALRSQYRMAGNRPPKKSATKYTKTYVQTQYSNTIKLPILSR